MKTDGENMINIGLDFGTTNSIISFYDRERRALDCFRLRADSSPYIPTVISYGRGRIDIGESAKEYLGSPDVYSHFKLLLEEDARSPMPGQEKTAAQAAGDYLAALLAAFQRAGNSVGKIVTTIPEDWYQKKKDGQGRRILEEIFQKKNFPPAEFLSEPAAAAAYYCWMYQYQQPEKNRERKPYLGNLLIIDYGGGTLDVSLCAVREEGNIAVADSIGFGRKEGCAGSAFDDEAVRLLCEAYGVNPDAKRRALIKAEFEQKLIVQTELCGEMMKDYYAWPEAMEEEEIFSLNYLDGNPVCCGHLARAFERVNRPALEKALGEILKKHGSETFQVVLVGGFSNFCCVEAAVRSYLGSRMGAADVRFSDILNQENKALAVAKGAALISEGMVRMEQETEKEFGLVLYGWKEETGCMGDVWHRLIPKGGRLADFQEPVYLPEEIPILPESAPETHLRIYAGSPETENVIPMEKSVGELLGGMSGMKTFRLGMKLGSAREVLLCLRDEEGRETCWPVNTEQKSAGEHL